MTTNASRKRRGRETEFIVARYLRRLWPRAEAVGSGAFGTDIKNTEPIPWEVKARRGFDPMSALRQAVKRDGDYHPVVLRPDGYGEATIDDWPAFLPLSELVSLFEQAGYSKITERVVGHVQVGDDFHYLATLLEEFKQTTLSKMAARL
jgi:hypothetical protein